MKIVFFTKVFFYAVFLSSLLLHSSSALSLSCSPSLSRTQCLQIPRSRSILMMANPEIHTSHTSGDKDRFKGNAMFWHTRTRTGNSVVQRLFRTKLGGQTLFQNPAAVIRTTRIRMLIRRAYTTTTATIGVVALAMVLMIARVTPVTARTNHYNNNNNNNLPIRIEGLHLNQPLQLIQKQTQSQSEPGHRKHRTTTTVLTTVAAAAIPYQRTTIVVTGAASACTGALAAVEIVRRQQHRQPLWMGVNKQIDSSPVDSLTSFTTTAPPSSSRSSSATTTTNTNKGASMTKGGAESLSKRERDIHNELQLAATLLRQGGVQLKRSPKKQESSVSTKSVDVFAAATDPTDRTLTKELVDDDEVERSVEFAATQAESSQRALQRTNNDGSGVQLDISTLLKSGGVQLKRSPRRQKSVSNDVGDAAVDMMNPFRTGLDLVDEEDSMPSAENQSQADSGVEDQVGIGMDPPSTATQVDDSTRTRATTCRENIDEIFSRVDAVSNVEGSATTARSLLENNLVMEAKVRENAPRMKAKVAAQKREATSRALLEARLGIDATAAQRRHTVVARNFEKKREATSRALLEARLARRRKNATRKSNEETKDSTSQSKDAIKSQ